MTNLTSISTNAVIGLMILFAALFAVQGTTVRHPANVIYAPSGEARQLPIDLLQLRVAMW